MAQVPVLLIFRVINHNGHLGSADPLSHSRFKLQPESFNPQFFQFLLQESGIDPQVYQGTQNHISADPCKTVVIQYPLHLLFIARFIFPETNPS